MTGGLNASSLVESVVAMAILLTILTIFFLQIDQIGYSVNPQAVYKAHIVIDQILCSDELLFEYAEEMEVDGYLVQKKIEKLQNDLYKIDIKVLTPKGKLIYDRSVIKSLLIEI